MITLRNKKVYRITQVIKLKGYTLIIKNIIPDSTIVGNDCQIYDTEQLICENNATGKTIIVKHIKRKIK